ncbi:hypothetical protein D0T51_00475 [Parabacteroides sp. 52]|uniref:Kelch repeat-containing protein n=1 Tax=unclassified Parabacteroides TaxID=2649774 RepID=UPI0013D33C05|nr:MULTISPECIES: kelch repeat-containing protein [unclassified Parabacteroides]MDH6533456.1 hypothetical protein [Parabacteroides sp. PM5-20]NDV54212.1 hypothetical protein [Parabacteroides sp. 52]
MKRIYIFLYSILLIVGLVVSCAEDPQMADNIIGAEKPTVTTKEEFTGRTATSVTVYGSVEKENGSIVTEKGFKWHIKGQSSSDKDFLPVGTGKGDFQGEITGLKDSTEYIIYAYATNSVGTSLGDGLSVTTISGLPIVFTLEIPADSVKAESVQVGGKVTKQGEGEILQRGVYYSEQSLLGATNPKDSVISNMQTDSFVCVIPGLKMNTQYYVQAFVRNKFGVATGLQKVIKTTDGLPRVGNLKEIKIDFLYAEFEAELLKEGDTPVKARGFCVGLNEMPTLENGADTVHLNNEESIFSGKLMNLSSDEEYYVRAFAENSYGIGYSEEVQSFMLLNHLPSVATNPIKRADSEKGLFHVSGEVKNEGLYKVVESGVCISYTTSNPTINDSYSDTIRISSGKGSFETTVYKIKGNKTYYVRAYAINENNKVAYGSTVTHTTPAIFTQADPFPSDAPLLKPGTGAFTSISNQGFFLGGDSGEEPTDKFWLFDSRGWNNQKKCPIKRSWIATSSVNVMMYIFGGLNENKIATNDFYSYNSNLNTWDEVSVSGQKPDPLFYSLSCSKGTNFVYLIGGLRKDPVSHVDTIIKDVWEYSIDHRTWTLKPSFPEGQYGGIAFTVDNVIYAGLGKNTFPSPTTHNSWFSSADGANTWKTEEGPLLQGAFASAGVVYYKTIYIVTNTGYIWKFDPQTKKWESKSQLIHSMKDIHCMFVIGDHIYIGLGENKTLLKYDPVWDN